MIGKAAIAASFSACATSNAAVRSSTGSGCAAVAGVVAEPILNVSFGVGESTPALAPPMFSLSLSFGAPPDGADVAGAGGPPNSGGTYCITSANARCRSVSS